jgi:vacuolar-type H+-ATPase subunit I/STV1
MSNKTPQPNNPAQMSDVQVRERVVALEKEQVRLKKFIDFQGKVVETIDAEITEKDKRIAELEKERDIRDLEKMALGLKASIDFWHSNTSSKMQGHIEYGILGKRPVDDPDAIPVEILERDMNALINQAKALKDTL